MEIKLPWNRQSAIKVPWQIFAGFFVAAVASLTMVISLMVRNVEGTRPWLSRIIIGLAAVGFFLMAIGGFLHWRAEKAGDESSHLRAFYLMFEFWGAILLVGAGPVYLFTRIANPPKPPPPPPPAIVVTQPVAPPPETNTPPPPRPEFPQLSLEGFVYNGARSTAVINGKTVQRGDTLNGVTIVSIEPEGVTVELDGERKVLKLEH